MADTEEISNRKPDDEQLAATNGNPDHPGIAAELYISCMALFRDAWTNSTSNQSPKLSQVSRRSLVRIQQNLFLWGETHKVKEGHLDDILRGSSHLMNLVIKLLRSIVSIVFHGTVKSLVPCYLHSDMDFRYRNRDCRQISEKRHTSAVGTSQFCRTGRP
jgi:hypothetical protein